MQISTDGLRLLRTFEGLRTSVYNDVAGLQTIGFGHRIKPGEMFPSPITPARAEQLLAQDVACAERAVNRLVTVPLTQSQFDALVDFVYNLGEARLAGSTLLRELNSGDLDGAAQQILRWDRAAGVEVPGLHRRRQAEYDLFTAADPAAPPTRQCDLAHAN